MTKINIFIDPTSPIHAELEEEIVKYIDSLETVEYKKTTMPSEAGKLNGIDLQTIKIVLEMSTAILEFITALMLITAQVNAAHPQVKQKGKTKEKPVEIDVEGVKMSLPMSDETSRKYIRTIKIKIEEKSSPAATTQKSKSNKKGKK